MTSSDGMAASTIRKKVTRRYWRREETDRRWSPIAVIPLLGLAVLFLIGAAVVAPGIEEDVSRRVHEELQAAGVAVSNVQSSGQLVSVVAEALPGDAKIIKAVAKATECESIFGRLTCPTSARVRLVEPKSAVVAPEPRAHEFVVIKSDDSVTLTGEVPDLEVHDRMVGIAGQRFGRVTNELSVSNEPATGPYSRAATQALAVAEHLVNGRASWTGDQLHVTGVVGADHLNQVREQFNVLRNGAGRGSFNVQVIDYAMQCDEQFQEAFGTSTIRFATASATIDSASEQLLEQLASIASQCPGVLVIEGHTDSRGEEGMNLALSRARAIAVQNSLIDLGIDRDRLIAIGYGETRPIADNSTASGRERNRRIAIVSDRPGER
ncbi:MAG: OmpA family protein [Gammaproteobacteria bacterium]|nr:OmpA family protein [Gammaproteobacteria bacterium]